MFAFGYHIQWSESLLVKGRPVLLKGHLCWYTFFCSLSNYWLCKQMQTKCLYYLLYLWLLFFVNKYRTWQNLNFCSSQVCNYSLVSLLAHPGFWLHSWGSFISGYASLKYSSFHSTPNIDIFLIDLQFLPSMCLSYV